MPQHLPSLNALRAFEVVARTGSVSAAASELFVTPGAISRQIKNLEEDFGVMLLERNGRGVRLTAAGEYLRNGLETAFAQISRTVDSNAPASAPRHDPDTFLADIRDNLAGSTDRSFQGSDA